MFFRGHLQRLKFHDQVARYREKERQQKLIEDFSRRVVAERKDFFLNLFTTKLSEPGIVGGEQEDKRGMILRFYSV